MDRRLFMLLAAAGIVDPGRNPMPGVGPEPGQSTPGEVVDGAPAPSGDPAFDAWLQSFFQRSATAGWSVEVLRRELGGLTPDPRVIALDGRQPELSKPIGDYMRTAVSDRNVALGRDKLADAQAWMPAVADRFGVPPQILTAIWGEESAYGAAQGDMDVIRSLASLASNGRRRDWAEGQIWDALRMITTGAVTRAQMKGSWAGAMGQTQLIPEAYLANAVDGDGDGRADIWNSAADAVASAANMLQKYGWRRGGGWAREVQLPAGFDYSVAEGPQQTAAEWALDGVRAASGADWSEADANAPAQLIVPAGARGPAFLVLPNHFIIRKYNNSTSYALAVGLLADRIAGAPPLLAAWPVEPALSSQDRIGAQQALAALGFSPGTADGVIGLNTRAAIRAWQKARGLPADGYLTAALSQQLQAEAGPRAQDQAQGSAAQGPATQGPAESPATGN
ncbi:MAG TPA: lytic murein transglycosylase [Caulobacteraceae bacterium]|nr:lytic murein transglycosylase [Caulobacteraceae bacterium]